MAGSVKVGERSRAAVRIWGPTHESGPVGMGFLVSGNRLMTCAHVVCDALGVARTDFEVSTDPPAGIVSLNFVRDRFPDEATHRARVVTWHAEREKSEFRDIAVLELIKETAQDRELPAEAKPVTACRANYPNDNVYAHGIKYGLPQGTIVEGHITDYVTDDRIEIFSSNPDQAVREGCSGGAIWNVTRGGIAGMIAEMHSDTQGRIIPVEILQQVFKGMEAAPEPGELLSTQPIAQPRLDQLGASMRELLYTFDREQQESAFDGALETYWDVSHGAIVCSIAGVDADRPKLCRDRCINVKLKARFSAMQIDSTRLRPTRVVWPERPIRDVKQELSKLIAQVKTPLGAKSAEAIEIRRRLNELVTPWIFFSLIERRWFDSGHRDLMLAWTQFWREVSAEPLNKPLAIFMLLRLDETETDTTTSLDLCLEQYFNEHLLPMPPAGAIALDRLSDFRRDDIEDWVRANADALGISDADLIHRVLPKLRDLPEHSLRLKHLEEWTDTLCR